LEHLSSDRRQNHSVSFALTTCLVCRPGPVCFISNLYHYREDDRDSRNTRWPVRGERSDVYPTICRERHDSSSLRVRQEIWVKCGSYSLSRVHRSIFSQNDRIYHDSRPVDAACVAVAAGCLGFEVVGEVAETLAVTRYRNATVLIDKVPSGRNQWAKIIKNSTLFAIAKSS
jgi:hypothetical protein